MLAWKDVPHCATSWETDLRLSLSPASVQVRPWSVETLLSDWDLFKMLFTSISFSLLHYRSTCIENTSHGDWHQAELWRWVTWSTKLEKQNEKHLNGVDVLHLYILTDLKHNFIYNNFRFKWHNCIISWMIKCIRRKEHRKQLCLNKATFLI